MYGNCNFICGSSVEVERLWSIAIHIITDIRKDMMKPMMFEVLLYLKINREYWDIHTVFATDVARLNGNSDSESTDSDDYIY